MNRRAEIEALAEWRHVRAHHEGLHRDLMKWASWVRVRPQQGKAQSAEGNYRPPQTWHPRSPSIPIDLKLMLAIERAVVGLPMPHRMHLKLFYVVKAKPQVVRRKLGMTMESVSLHIHWCRDLVAFRLQRLDVDE